MFRAASVAIASESTVSVRWRMRAIDSSTCDATRRNQLGSASLRIRYSRPPICTDTTERLLTAPPWVQHLNRWSTVAGLELRLERRKTLNQIIEALARSLTPLLCFGDAEFKAANRLLAILEASPQLGVLHLESALALYQSSDSPLESLQIVCGLTARRLSRTATRCGS